MSNDPSDHDDPAASRPAGVRVTAAKCVRCHQPVQPRYRPFCSQRCADIDLGAWFTDRYRVPTDEPPMDGEESDTSDEKP